MSELISGKEALTALANGEDVRYIGHAFSHEIDSKSGNAIELSVDEILNDRWAFKLKPRTITINGIELNKPDDVSSYDGAVIIKCDTQDDADKLADALRSVFNEG